MLGRPVRLNHIEAKQKPIPDGGNEHVLKDKHTSRNPRTEARWLLLWDVI
tara:strand:- start:152 stop:301 length:150 start_codon:yes stop_codon:yes gene_type:complete